MYLPTARNPAGLAAGGLCPRSGASAGCSGWIRARTARVSRSRTGTAVRETDEDKAMTKSERRSERVWSVPLALSDVPESGRHFDLVADAQARAAVAKHAGLLPCPGSRLALTLRC